MPDDLSLLSLYLRTPSLEYREAFNLAIKEHWLRCEPILVLASSAVHAVELFRRCRAPLHIWSSVDYDAAQWIVEGQSLACGPVCAVSPSEHEPTYTAIVWAEPERHTAKKVIQAFNGLAVPGTNLNIINSGPLHRFLPAWQTAPYPASNPLFPGEVALLITACGWKIDQQIAFHGPRSIFWSWLARMADRIGRPDWADRSLLAMRSVYQDPGWLWPLAPLVLIQATKE